MKEFDSKEAVVFWLRLMMIGCLMDIMTSTEIETSRTVDIDGLLSLQSDLEWTSLTTTQQEVFGHATVQYNCKMLSTGGFIIPNPDQLVLTEYDPSINQWTSLQVDQTCYLPVNRKFHSATIFQDHLLVFGGDGGPLTNELIALNLTASPPCWRRITPTGDAPQARRDHIAVVVNDSMYIHGGRGFSGLLNDTWKFRFPADWSILQLVNDVIPSSREQHSAVVFDANMFVFGGAGGIEVLADFWRLEFGNNEDGSRGDGGSRGDDGSRGDGMSEWKQLSDGVEARFWHRAGIFQDDKMVVIGGHDAEKVAMRNFVFDFGSESWSELLETLDDDGGGSGGGSGFEPVFIHSLEVLCNNLYVFGGNDETFNENNRLQILKTNDCLALPNTSTTISSELSIDFIRQPPDCCTPTAIYQCLSCSLMVNGQPEITFEQICNQKEGYQPFADDVECGGDCSPEDPCCDEMTCMYLPSGTICEESRECVNQSVCTGMTAICPSQHFPEGSVCGNDGVCVNGICKDCLVNEGGLCCSEENEFLLQGTICAESSECLETSECSGKSAVCPQQRMHPNRSPCGIDGDFQRRGFCEDGLCVDCFCDSQSSCCGGCFFLIDGTPCDESGVCVNGVCEEEMRDEDNHFVEGEGEEQQVLEILSLLWNNLLKDDFKTFSSKLSEISSSFETELCTSLATDFSHQSFLCQRDLTLSFLLDETSFTITIVLHNDGTVSSEELLGRLEKVVDVMAEEFSVLQNEYQLEITRAQSCCGDWNADCYLMDTAGNEFQRCSQSVCSKDCSNPLGVDCVVCCLEYWDCPSVCPAGSFTELSIRSEGIISCNLCPRGTFQSSENQKECECCQKGMFSNQRGALKCEVCETVEEECSTECEPEVFNDKEIDVTAIIYVVISGVIGLIAVILVIGTACKRFILNRSSHQQAIVGIVMETRSAQRSNDVRNSSNINNMEEIVGEPQ